MNSAMANYLFSFFANYCCIMVIGMLAVFVLTGLVGMFSMGQAAFMAVGGYTSALLSRALGTSIWMNIPASILMGMLFGLFVGLPAIRLKKDYIAIITLLFGQAVVALLNNSAKLTGGSLGLSGIPKQTSEWLIILFLVLTVLLIANFKKSRFGRQCLAVKSDELAAAGMGIDVARIKLYAFIIAGGISAFAGTLWVHTTTYIDPASFGWTQSSMWIIIVFFGGINSLTGSIVAGILLTALPELLRFSNELRIIIYCVIVLFVVNFRPQGLFGKTEWDIATIKRTVKRIRAWGAGLQKKKEGA